MFRHSKGFVGSGTRRWRGWGRSHFNRGGHWDSLLPPPRKVTGVVLSAAGQGSLNMAAIAIYAASKIDGIFSTSVKGAAAHD